MASTESFRSPYPGPRPFEQHEGDLFFGRRREVLDLLSLVIAHRAVLLYAQSGAGKSSLLNAGLIPMLVQEGFDVLPTARLRGIEPAGGLDRVSNIYAFNAAVRLTPNADPASLLSTALDAWLAGRPHSKDEYGDDRPRLLIIDQFEELFTAYPECAKQREAFMQQVARALDADPLLRVLFAIREDYLAGVDPFAMLLPEHLRVRYRMERLGPEAACSAVVEPAAALGRTFAKGAADQLIAQLLLTRVEDPDGKARSIPGDYVEPVQLQVVCKRLWDMLPANVTEISAEVIGSLGNVDEALCEFYETALKKAVNEPQVTEKTLRTWFEKKLITSSGTRSTVHRDKDDTGGLPNATIDRLEEAHIIRAEQRGGARWYELTHDRLIGPILDSNRKWTGMIPAIELLYERHEARASEWDEKKRPARLLLDENELAEARCCVGRPAGVSTLLRTYLASSEAAVERDRMRRSRWVKYLAAVASLALLAAVVAIFSAMKADRNERSSRSASLAVEVLLRMAYPATSAKGYNPMDTLRMAVKEWPDNAQVQLLIGMLLARSEPESAIVHLSRAVEIGKLAEEYAYRDTIAQLCLRTGDTIGALFNLDSAFSLNPTLLAATMQAGLIYRTRRSYDTAIEHFQNALEDTFATPDSMSCLIQLAECYQLVGEGAEADAYLNRAGKQSPEDWRLRLSSGRVHFWRGEYDRARELIAPSLSQAMRSRAPELLPSDFVMLASIYDILQNRDSAAKWYAHAATSYLSCLDLTSAKKYQDTAVKLQPQRAGPLAASFSRLSVRLLNNDRPEAARTALHFAIGLRQQVQDTIGIAEDWRRLAHLYYDNFFLYDSAFIADSTAWAVGDDASDKMNMAEAALLCGRLRVADLLASGLLADLGRDSSYRIPMEFIVMSARLSQGDVVRAREAFDQLASEFDADTAEREDIWIEWNYSGTRHFLTTESKLPLHRHQFLLDVLDYLDPPEAPPGRKEKTLPPLKTLRPRLT